MFLLPWLLLSILNLGSLNAHTGSWHDAQEFYSGHNIFFLFISIRMVIGKESHIFVKKASVTICTRRTCLFQFINKYSAITFNMQIVFFSFEKLSLYAILPYSFNLKLNVFRILFLLLNLMVLNQRYSWKVCCK